ncbi:SOS response-associated peptidase family protein [Spongiivirga sp. MCCC 1A20706]|uniref:SOS response-associated peptidase family protein n=1 Tax=Spongiivirga sp. MCCC 1A20706 TaxID=3160963 RepID=UPI003977CB0C
MFYDKALTANKNRIEEITGKTMAVPLSYESYYHKYGLDHPALYMIPQEDPEYIYPVQWGFIPDWAVEDPYSFREKYDTLNVNDKTLFDNNTYNQSILRKRCLIISDGFFLTCEKNNTVQHHFWYISDESEISGRSIFMIAGVYNDFDPADDLYTAAIITTSVKPSFENFNSSQLKIPLVLDETFCDDSLMGKLDKPHVRELLRVGFTVEELCSHRVSEDLKNINIDTNRSYILNPDQ